MPHFTFQDRRLRYELYGSKARLPGQPTIVVLANEYRSIDVALGALCAGFGPEIDAIVLENTNMGQSDRTTDPLSQEQLIEEVTAFCAAMEIDIPIFTGFCGNVELAFLYSKAYAKTGVIALSPMMRTEDGNFVEYLFDLFKRNILDGDAAVYCDAFLLLDPHNVQHRASRRFPQLERFGSKQILQEKEHLWTKALQNKSLGTWQWSELPDYPHPVLMIRGEDDVMQIPSLIRASFVRDHHKDVVLETSHRVAECEPEAVRQHIGAFAAFCAARHAAAAKDVEPA